MTQPFYTITANEVAIAKSYDYNKVIAIASDYLADLDSDEPVPTLKLITKDDKGRTEREIAIG